MATMHHNKKNLNAVKAVTYDNPKSFIREWGRSIGIVLAIVIIFGVALGLWHIHNVNRLNKQKNVAAAAQLEYNAVWSEAVSDDHAGNYMQEAQVLQTYIKSNPPKQYQYQPLIQLGTLSYNNRQDAEAITYFMQAEKAAGKDQSLDAADLAAAFQAEDNKVLAIQYYQKAIQLTQVEPGIGNQITDYKEAIQYLGGTP